MRSIIIFSLILLVACGQQTQTTQSDTFEQDRQAALGYAINQFNTAFLEVDIPALDSLTTPTYLHTNGSYPPISKEIWMSFLERRKQAIEDSSLEIGGYRMDELEIQFHDDAAWVSGLIRTIGRRDSVIFDDEIRVSHMWVWEDGLWKRAAFQDAKRVPVD